MVLQIFMHVGEMGTFCGKPVEPWWANSGIIGHWRGGGDRGKSIRGIWCAEDIQAKKLPLSGS